MTTTQTRVHPAEYARTINPTVKISYGIAWIWAIGFTKEQAEEFVRWLEANQHDHRGVYPPTKAGGTYDVRFR